MWERFFREVCYSARVLRRRPGFSAAVILTLALGIASTGAIFSALHSVILRPLPFKDPERIVTIWNRYGKDKEFRATVSVPDYFDRKEQSKTLEAVAAFEVTGFDLTDLGEPDRLVGARVTASWFPLLGVQPVVGRFFLPEEDEPGKENVVVISHAFWVRRLGQDLNVLQRRITLNGVSNRVVGVMPRGFRYPDAEVEIWKPIAFRPEQRSNDERGNEMLSMIGRMKKGVSLSRARAEMNWIAAQVPVRVPERREFLLNAGWGALVIPLQQFLSGEIRPALLALMGSALFFLLIVCANVAHLMLVHDDNRRGENAVRAALGATRRQLLRGQLIESSLLTLAGASCSLPLIALALGALNRHTPVDVSLFGEIRLDTTSILFVIFLSILLGAILGLISTSRNKTWTHIQSRATRSSGFRETLVSVEIALALVLFISALLMMRSFVHLLSEAPGFDATDRWVMSITLPPARYPEPPQRAEFYRDLLGRIRGLPGVIAAGAAGTLPLTGEHWTATFAVDGYRPPPGGVDPGFQYSIVTPGYFKAMGIPLRLGREFDEHDNRQSLPVAVVNERLAQRFWPESNPIGKRIGFSDPQDKIEWREVVGVAGSVKSVSLQSSPEQEVYIPHSQFRLSAMTVVVHGNAGLLPAIRSTIASIDPQLPVDHVRAFDQIVDASLARPRFLSWLLSAFSGISLLLAVIGVFSVTAYTVRKRTREIGIRMALGATEQRITFEILRRGLIAAMVGICSGAAGTLALGRLLQSFLFGVRSTDPLIFVASCLLMAGSAAIACYVPAFRAARMHPVAALREE